MQTILFSLSAALIWGFNDFLIQRSTRKIGAVLTFFVLSLVAVLILLPFVDYYSISNLTTKDLLFIILIPGIFSSAATFLEFQSFKFGPISVVENLMTFEIPMSVMLAVFFGEQLTNLAFLIIFINCIGLFCMSDSMKHIFDLRHLVSNYFLLGILAAVFFSLTNLSVGISAKDFGVLETMFFMNLMGLIFSFIGLLFLSYKKQITFRQEIALLSKAVFVIAVFDLLAWCAYSYAGLSRKLCLVFRF